MRGVVAIVREQVDGPRNSRAQGPTYHGIVKIVDADKNMITLLIGSKDGEGGENREFKTFEGYGRVNRGHRREDQAK